MKDNRLDPDAILKAIRKEEESRKKGKLRIFFGMSAGVGKTFAMLRAAQVKRKEGVNVVVGLVETHGRAETQALLGTLPVIPRKKIDYRGTILEEMDIDAILEKKPELVLIDELAHTNIPGSRHPKRWQDVVEVLEAGVDVYSTLNVQHLESRKEAVEQIAGISIRETVPDSILERASQIQLIDITPNELLNRLKEGKVYLGDKAEQAAKNFFKEDRLTALREISLRLTAEKVDSELQEMIVSKDLDSPWKTTERLMVAISHSPYSERLIRATRRLAFNLEAPWIAVYVDPGIPLNEQDQTMLARNIALSRELGAEVITTADPSIVDALKRVAKQRNVTQIVFGRPTKRWFREITEGGSILDQLVRESGDTDIIVLRRDSEPRVPSWWSRFQAESAFVDYWTTIWAIAGTSVISYILLPWIGYRAVGFVFLLGVLISSLFLSLGPILFFAISSALIWDYFFIPPFGTFSITQPEDMVMCAVYLIAAVITGTLTRRIRRRERMLRAREERTNILYEMVRDMVAAENREALVQSVITRLNSALMGQCAVALKKETGELEHFKIDEIGWTHNEKEWAVAKWAFDHNKPAGFSTDTLGQAGALYIPLRGQTEKVGVFAYRPGRRLKLIREEEHLLFTAARQLAISLERDLFRTKSQEASRLEESEKLHQTILDCVSHEMRTPLTSIIGTASALQNKEVLSSEQNRQELTNELVRSSHRLNRVVENILDMSRLSAGRMTLKRDWNDLSDLINVTLHNLKDDLSSYVVRNKIEENLPLVRIDFNMFEHALSNLLLNAAKYSADERTIEIVAQRNGNQVTLSVSDRGPGILSSFLPHVFEKFYRVPGSPTGGIGLGLAIVKSIVEAHGGQVEAKSLSSGGTRFSIALPIEEQPSVPLESHP